MPTFTPDQLANRPRHPSPAWVAARAAMDWPGHLADALADLESAAARNKVAVAALDADIATLEATVAEQAEAVEVARKELAPYTRSLADDLLHSRIALAQKQHERFSTSHAIAEIHPEMSALRKGKMYTPPPIVY